MLVTRFVCGRVKISVNDVVKAGVIGAVGALNSSASISGAVTDDIGDSVRGVVSVSVAIRVRGVVSVSVVISVRGVFGVS